MDSTNQNPCIEIKKIQFIANEWILEIGSGMKLHFSNSTILISNSLFQIIQFAHPKRRKLIVLFHDQLSPTDLRLIHLKTR